MGAAERATGIRFAVTSRRTRVVSSAKCNGLIIQLVTKEMRGLWISASRPPAIMAAIAMTSRAFAGDWAAAMTCFVVLARAA